MNETAKQLPVHPETYQTRYPIRYPGYGDITFRNVSNSSTDTKVPAGFELLDLVPVGSYMFMVVGRPEESVIGEAKLRIAELEKQRDEATKAHQNCPQNLAILTASKESHATALADSRKAMAALQEKASRFERDLGVITKHYGQAAVNEVCGRTKSPAEPNQGGL